MEDVYISCTPTDAAAAKRFCSDLEASGIRCRVCIADPSARPASTGSIPPVLLCTRIYVPLVSRHSLSSAVMKNELYWATEEYIPIFPVYLDKAPLNDSFSFYLGTKQWISVKRSLGTASKKLCRVIRDELEPQQKKTAEPADNSEKETNRLIIRAMLCIGCVLAYLIISTVLSSLMWDTHYSLFWNIDAVLGLAVGVIIFFIMAPMYGGYKVFLRTIAEKLRDAFRGE